LDTTLTRPAAEAAGDDSVVNGSEGVLVDWDAIEWCRVEQDVRRLAGAGLLLLLAAAVLTHVRHHDGAGKIAPAVVCAVLVAGYLAALPEAAS
jgi:hypothetical protein